MLKKKILSLCVFFIFFSFCKNKKTTISETAYILGKNDIQVFSAANLNEDFYTQAFNASVLLTTKLNNGKIKFCSGTLSKHPDFGSRPFIISNHHCFAIPGENGRASPNLLPESCQKTDVYFGYSTNINNVFKTKCDIKSFRTSYDGDLSIFNLETDPPAPYLPIEMIDPKEKNPENQEAIIIHYPSSEESGIENVGTNSNLPVAAVTKTDCNIQDFFAQDEWKLDRLFPFSFKHTCDLVHGSSGSSIISHRLNSQEPLIYGVNWGGVELKYGSELVKINVAIGPEFITAFIQNRVAEFKTKTLGTVQNSQDLSQASGASNSKAGVETKETAEEEKKKKWCGVIKYPCHCNDKLILLFPILFAGFFARRKLN